MANKQKQKGELAATIMKGLEEIKALKDGKQVNVIAHKPNEFDVSTVRRKLDLSQAEFAETYGFNLRTLQAWEAGRTAPTGASLQLLKMIDAAPKRMLNIADSVQGRDHSAIDDAMLLIEAIERAQRCVTEHIGAKRVGIAKEFKLMKSTAKLVQKKLEEAA